jgi:hypothetical protein
MRRVRGGYILRPVNFNCYLRRWCPLMASYRFRACALTSRRTEGWREVVVLWSWRNAWAVSAGGRADYLTRGRKYGARCFRLWTGRVAMCRNTVARVLPRVRKATRMWMWRSHVSIFTTLLLALCFSCNPSRSSQGNKALPSNLHIYWRFAVHSTDTHRFRWICATAVVSFGLKWWGMRVAHWQHILISVPRRGVLLYTILPEVPISCALGYQFQSVRYVWFVCLPVGLDTRTDLQMSLSLALSVQLNRLSGRHLKRKWAGDVSQCQVYGRHAASDSAVLYFLPSSESLLRDFRSPQLELLVQTLGSKWLVGYLAMPYHLGLYGMKWNDYVRPTGKCPVSNYCSTFHLHLQT